MNLPGIFSGDGDATGNRPSPRRELQLQGPRPAALKVNKESHKIRKPPIAPPPHHPPPPSGAPPPPFENRQPVIIYTVPPKVIHTTVGDYKSLVQRLTGNATAEGAAASSSSSYGGDVSPAARLASIEKTSPPKEREAAAAAGADSDTGNFTVGDFVGDTNVEMGALPGILSPAPGSLPPISPGFFSAAAPISPGFWSPGGDPFMMGYNMFTPSPSTLFSAPMVSPSPSSADLYYPFFDF